VEPVHQPAAAEEAVAVIARTAFSSQRSIGDVTTFMPSEPFDDMENQGLPNPAARKFWNPPLR